MKNLDHDGLLLNISVYISDIYVVIYLKTVSVKTEHLGG